MANLGFLANMFDAVRGGLAGAGDIYNQSEERKLKKQSLQADLASKGLLQDEEGNIKQDPASFSKLNQERQAADPNSDVSKRSREFTRATLSQINPELSKTISDTMSAKDIERYHDLVKAQMTGSYGLQRGQMSNEGRQMSNDRANRRTELMEQNLGMRKTQMENKQGVDASKAGQAFETGLAPFKKTLNSLDRATDIINGKEPVTAKSFNLLQQDFINAMAPGGAATEGKVNRELIETGLQELNNLKLKFGTVDDLRKNQPQVINHLKNLISQVRGDYEGAMSNQASDIHDSFSDSPNPTVQKTIQRKLQRYSPKAFSEKYGAKQSQPNQSSETYGPSPKGDQGLLGAPSPGLLDPKIAEYAKQYQLPYEQAQALLKQRGYGR